MVKEKEKLSNDEMQNVKRPKLGKLSKVNVRIPLIPITNTVTGSAEETKPSTKPAPAEETSEPVVIEDEVINLHPEQTDISTVMKADVDPMNAQLGIFNIIYNYNRRRRSH